MNARIVLIRHGETEWSRAGRHTGRTDVPLTELGRHQADATGVALRRWKFGTVLCSPLGRARETCERAGLIGAAQFSDDLREWDYGVYEGRTTDEVQAEVANWTVWTAPVPGGESPHQVGGRADAVITRALSAAGPVAIFAHGQLLRILAARWIDLDPTAGARFVLDEASISTLGFEHSLQAITGWNDIDHLRGLPQSVPAHP